VFVRILFLVLSIFAISPSHADQACNLDGVRKSFRALKAGASTYSYGQTVNRVDRADDGMVQEVAVDETIAAFDLIEHHNNEEMLAPNAFKFRSGWMLNTQFAFSQGDQFRIRSVVTSNDGERFYALTPPGKPKLIIYAKEDGSLCDKVMNTDGGDYVYLVKTYKSTPSTKLVARQTSTSGAPQRVKLVLLSTSGGLLSIREIWSKNGSVVSQKDHSFDSDARNVEIAGIHLNIQDAGKDLMRVSVTHN